MIKLESQMNPESTICEPCKCAGSIKYIHRDCLKVINGTSEYNLNGTCRDGSSNVKASNASYVTLSIPKSGLSMLLKTTFA